MAVMTMNEILREGRWVKIQHKAFLRWINIQLEGSQDLKVKNSRVRNLQKDLSDGVILNYLMKEISKGNYNKSFATKPKFRINYIDNISCVLNYLKESDIQLHNIGAEDIYEGNLKLVLGLIWALILNFTLSNLQDNKATDFSTIRKTLLQWCQKCVQQFDGMVKITDFSTSWNNGVAISALLSSLRPDLMDFYTLDLTRKEANTKKVIALASNIGIPQLVDYEDLLVQRPDEKVVITYLIGWYEKFNGKLIGELTIHSTNENNLAKPIEKSENRFAKPVEKSENRFAKPIDKSENKLANEKPAKSNETPFNKSIELPTIKSTTSLATELKEKINKAKMMKRQKSILSLARSESSVSSPSSLSRDSSISKYPPSSISSKGTSDNARKSTNVNSVVLQFETQAAEAIENNIKSTKSVKRLSEFKQRWLNSLTPHMDLFYKTSKENSSISVTSDPSISSMESSVSSLEKNHKEIEPTPIPRRSIKRNKRRPAPVLQLSPSSEDFSAISGSFDIIDSTISLDNGVNATAFIDASYDDVDQYYGESNDSDDSYPSEDAFDQSEELNVSEFRNYMVSLSDIFNLKSEYERRAKIFSSNIRTQIYKWTNLVSYNELYDLEELDYEKRFLENNFQNSKKSILYEKNALTLLYCKINNLLTSLSTDLYYYPCKGASLADLETNWKNLCQEEMNYVNMVDLKLHTLKDNLKANYMDVLKVVNKKTFELKFQVDEYLIKQNHSMSADQQRHRNSKLLDDVARLDSLVLNISEMYQQLLKYNISYKKELFDTTIHVPVAAFATTGSTAADSNIINPFAPVDSALSTTQPVALMDYNELIFEVKLLQESITSFAHFARNKSTCPENFSITELSNMFGKASKSPEYITKKEFRSFICSSPKFDKQYSKKIESCLPIHHSRQGYDYKEFVASVADFGSSSSKLLDSPVIIKADQPVSLSRNSSVYSDRSFSPFSSPETVSRTNSPNEIYNTPVTIYESEEETQVVSKKPTNKHSPHVKRTAKDSKFPTKFQVPMNFTIVLENQYSVLA